MKDIIYVDRFTNEYTKNKQDNAPSERYIEIVSNGKDDFYKEIWSCVCNDGSNCRLGVSYLERDIHDEQWLKDFRETLEYQNNVRMKYIIRWYVPDHKYQEILSYL